MVLGKAEQERKYLIEQSERVRRSEEERAERLRRSLEDQARRLNMELERHERETCRRIGSELKVHFHILFPFPFCVIFIFLCTLQKKRFQPILPRGFGRLKFIR